MLMIFLVKDHSTLLWCLAANQYSTWTVLCSNPLHSQSANMANQKVSQIIYVLYVFGYFEYFCVVLFDSIMM